MQSVNMHPADVVPVVSESGAGWHSVWRPLPRRRRAKAAAKRRNLDPVSPWNNADSDSGEDARTGWYIDGQDNAEEQERL